MAIALFLKLGFSDRRILEYMYLSAFSRYPTGDERRVGWGPGEIARAGGERSALGRAPQALEDMVWAMLTSKEFLFNH